MTNSENLLYMMRINQRALKALLDDITEEESMVRGRDSLLHIRWLTGHLVYNVNHVLAMIGSLPVMLPSSYKQLFDRGSAITNDPKAYPSLAALRSELLDLHDRLIDVLPGVSDDDLDEPLPKDAGFNAVRLNAASFMCMHTFYHCGQIAMIRRVLGRERSFG
ncbi:MAG TPA: DinB family protein [candidate division Zixibacteria bacterium]|nr:DinB family protein [candidate division Zixibacteria bacterium]MDD4917766.1 DinB family protein [candidate division Zixibacteria bacterium]MDM7973729.1 DinB family protein [candidate division Zixibacteria bacterium]HOD67137.1 DinB family protein [candidate division Zixibacteria bacterium]HOZ08755.1 DinB family protein [candidate division Zixibacteria bacterium]